MRTLDCQRNLIIPTDILSFTYIKFKMTEIFYEHTPFEFYDSIIRRYCIDNVSGYLLTLWRFRRYPSLHSPVKNARCSVAFNCFRRIQQTRVHCKWMDQGEVKYGIPRGSVFSGTFFKSIFTTHVRVVLRVSLSLTISLYFTKPTR